jgi:hypothetical protein
MRRQRMPFLALLVGAVTLAIGPVAGAATADEVLARYEAARGGVERWRALRSITAKGTFTSFSRDEAFTLQWKRPGLYSFESRTLNQPIRIGRDAAGPWWSNPPMGASFPTRLADRLGAIVARDTEVEPPLMEAARKGHRVELLGPGEIDGRATLGLRVTLANGEVETWHLDATSFLEIAVDSTVFDFTQAGEAMDQRAYFSDFRTVSGIVVPFKVEKEYKSRYTVLALSELTVDAPLDDDSFRMPLPPGMETLRPLAGDWDVAVEVRGNPRAPWQGSTTTSTITAEAEGALLTERIRHQAPFGGTTDAHRWRSYDRHRERYRFVEFDAGTSYLNVFEGPLDNQKVTVSNQTTGTAVLYDGRKIFERYTLLEVGADSFRLEYELSFDEGATWFNAMKMAYTRRKG